jgi:hypothetical protein
LRGRNHKPSGRRRVGNCTDGRRRPDGFSVNEKEHIIYVLEFKRVSDTGQEYVTETQKLAEVQHLVVTQDLQKLLKDT